MAEQKEETKNIFSFGNFSTSNFVFGADTTTPATTTETAENEDPEKDEVKINFEPVVKLTEVKMITGEEDEECMYKMYVAILFIDLSFFLSLSFFIPLISWCIFFPLFI